MKFSIITISFLVSVLFLIHMTLPASCPVPLPAQYEHVKPGNIVAAYFLGTDIYRKVPYDVDNIYPIAHKLTHLIYAFAKPDPKTSSCELQDPLADVGSDEYNHSKLSGNFEKLLKLKKDFPHLKILLSIGGGTYGKYISEIVQKGSVKKFITSCVSLLDQYQYQYQNSQTGEWESVTYQYSGLFDGIDFDWEWAKNKVPEFEANAYFDMIVQARTLLDKRVMRNKTKSLLTVALQVSAAVYKVLPVVRMASYVDWFHVMSYDFVGPSSATTGLNAPICNPWSSYSIDNAVHGLMTLGLSPQKMVLGIPLYGYAFDQTNGKLGASFVKTDRTKAMSYNKIKETYINNPSCEYIWHEKSSVPYLYCRSDKVFVSFEDERSVREKVAYARKKRLRGVMFWRLATDDDEHTLVKAIS